jgi:hypothetical protein
MMRFDSEKLCIHTVICHTASIQHCRSMKLSCLRPMTREGPRNARMQESASLIYCRSRQMRDHKLHPIQLSTVSQNIMKQTTMNEARMTQQKTIVISFFLMSLSAGYSQVETNVNMKQCIQALQSSDSSGDGLIQLSEYNDLLEQISPVPSCIQPNLFGFVLPDQLQQTFDTLSCLCENYSSNIANMPCCESDGGIAVPGIYSDSYTSEVCTTIAQTLQEVCLESSSMPLNNNADNIVPSLSTSQAKFYQKPDSSKNIRSTNLSNTSSSTAKMAIRERDLQGKPTAAPTKKPKSLFGVLLGLDDDDGWTNNAFKTDSAAPTATPTSTPTASPTATPSTTAPTATPTISPTAAETQSTSEPTAAPTATPTASPTVAPTTAQSTESSTASPTSSPTATPTAALTVAPTSEASVTESPQKTSAPSAAPTTSPTNVRPSTNAKPTTNDHFEPTPQTTTGSSSQDSQQNHDWIMTVFLPVLLAVFCLAAIFIALHHRRQREKEQAKFFRTNVPPGHYAAKPIDPTESTGSDPMPTVPVTPAPDCTMSAFLAVLEGLQETEYDVDSEMGEVTSSRYVGSPHGTMRPKDIPPSP